MLYNRVMTNYFLYARKSTDVEDKQVRSIEDQLAVLRALAKEQGLNIVHEFIEKQSAKIPNRPVFNEMLARIEKGEAQGIICWKLDRLARNPIDGGQISWFLQKGIIEHIQTHDRSYRPSDNILMMSVEFGMATQYILDLSANTKRGLYEKVKRGEYPSIAPIGYLNDARTKTVAVNRNKAKIVKEAFELYSHGQSRLEDIAELFLKRGIVSKEGNRLHLSNVTKILSNPFYYGHFRYVGELYEGKYQPLITKKLFDKVQEVMKHRGWQDRKENDPRPLCGLLKCGECGCSITAEGKTKKQKNGNIHNYTYYHCTKKKGLCSQPCIREEVLASQLSDVLKTYAMPSNWAVELSRLADKDEQEAVQSSTITSQATRDEIATISSKLKRLRGIYIDEDIEQDEYLAEKSDLLSRKKSLEEKMTDLEQGIISWLEPLREWIKDASNIEENAISSNLPLKKLSVQKIFGSNLFLKNRRIEFNPIPPYAELCSARKNFSEKEFCLLSVRTLGIEPRTSVLSGQRSTTELCAQIFTMGYH